MDHGRTYVYNGWIMEGNMSITDGLWKDNLNNGWITEGKSKQRMDHGRTISTTDGLRNGEVSTKKYNIVRQKGYSSTEIFSQ